jgi:hypothetical protein
MTVGIAAILDSQPKALVEICANPGPSMTVCARNVPKATGTEKRSPHNVIGRWGKKIETDDVVVDAVAVVSLRGRYAAVAFLCEPRRRRNDSAQLWRVLRGTVGISCTEM